MTKQTRILFFGALKDAAGVSERIETLPPSVKTPDMLIAYLAADDPRLMAALRAPTVRIAVDQEIRRRDDMIGTPSEIAFMAPFSGG